MREMNEMDQFLRDSRTDRVTTHELRASKS